MNVNVYNAVAALLEADASLTATDKERILAVCKHPGEFGKSEEERLPRLLTVNEATKILHVSRATLWRMRMAGQIREVRLRGDGSPRFSMDDIEALINPAGPHAGNGYPCYPTGVKRRWKSS